MMRADHETCSTCGRDIPRSMDCWGVAGAYMCALCHREQKAEAAAEARREALAAVSHDIWSHWMRYLFRVCVRIPDGSVNIPPEKVERWTRQMDAPYTSLSEMEKQSDRDQAEKILAVLGQPLR